jgi:hypothetical protein
MLLSCWHVLVKSGGAIGDKISQPGVPDGGKCDGTPTDGTVGNVGGQIVLPTTTDPGIDAAVAFVPGADGLRPNSLCKIVDIESISGTIPFQVE